MKRPAKVERGIQEKLKKQAKRYNKPYSGEPVHLDTKRLHTKQAGGMGYLKADWFVSGSPFFIAT